MNKLFIIPILLFLSTVNLYSQAEIVAEGLPLVCEMHIYNDHLYFTTNEYDEEDMLFSRLGKIDLLKGDVEVEYIFEPNFAFTGLYIHDDKVYYSVNGDTGIYRLHIDSIDAEPEILVDHLYYTRDLLVVGSKFFVVGSDHRDYSPIVMQYDLINLQTPPKKLFLNKEPIRVIEDNDFLYITSMWDDRIYRQDLLNLESDFELIVDSLSTPTSLIIVDQFLYFTSLKEPYNGGSNVEIYNIELDNQDRSTSFITDGLRGPHELAYHDGFIYVTEVFGNRISRIPLPLSTSTKEQALIEYIQIYPNPTSDFISLGSLEKEESYTILGTNGQEYSKGLISSNKRIDVSELPSGNYFITIGDSHLGRFVKQN